MVLKCGVLVGVALVGLVEVAEAQSFNQFYAFGDSTTDAGWFTGASSGPHSSGENAFDSAIAAAIAAGANGHWTGPGPGNAQIFASYFGLTANAVGTPGGTNFAIGGAVDYLVPPGYFATTATGNLLPNPLLPGTATQIQNLISQSNGHVNPNALYLINSGGNNTAAALEVFGPSSPAATTYLLGEAQALANSIVQLQAAGARYIIVGDTYIPPGTSAAQVTYGQIITGANWYDLAAAKFNFIAADTTSVIAAVERTPLAFGITAPIDSYACILPPGFGPTSNGILCAPTTTPSTAYGYLVSADALQTHLFLDGLHLTEAGQKIIADYYYNLVVAPSEISFLAESPLKTRMGVVETIRNQIPLSFGTAGTFHGWIGGDASWLKANNSSGFPGDPGTPLAASGGFDYSLSRDWLIGVAFSAGFADQTFSLGGDFKQTEFAVSLYTAYRRSAFWADAIATWGSLKDSLNRQVPLGITIQSNQGSTSGSNISLAAEGGYNFQTAIAGMPSGSQMSLKAQPAGAIVLTHGPVFGMIAQQVHVDAFAETNLSDVPTNLAFGSQVRNSAVTELGYQASVVLGRWEPFARAVWDHELCNTNRLVTATLLSVTAPSYSMPAVLLGRDWGTATLGARLKFAPEMTAYAAVTSQVGQSNVTTYGGQVGLNVAFEPPGVGR